MFFVSAISVTLCVNYIVSSLGYLGTDHQLFFFESKGGGGEEGGGGWTI